MVRLAQRIWGMPGEIWGTRKVLLESWGTDFPVV